MICIVSALFIQPNLLLLSYHFFGSLGSEKVILYGICDFQKNRGYVALGNSKDTSEFACESNQTLVEQLWKNRLP
ncbi:hypothetical protein [Tychonema sp. LEGE 07203]|uniref:ISAzo13-like element transposase-related protein n=1 Tax=Tychonema sp. LEGE 07203 TaxID=1828671 RepID=UPI00351C4E46